MTPWLSTLFQQIAAMAVKMNIQETEKIVSRVTSITPRNVGNKEEANKEILSTCNDNTWVFDY